MLVPPTGHPPSQESQLSRFFSPLDEPQGNPPEGGETAKAMNEVTKLKMENARLRGIINNIKRDLHEQGLGDYIDDRCYDLRPPRPKPPAEAAARQLTGEVPCPERRIKSERRAFCSCPCQCYRKGWFNDARPNVMCSCDCLDQYGKPCGCRRQRPDEHLVNVEGRGWRWVVPTN